MSEKSKGQGSDDKGEEASEGQMGLLGLMAIGVGGMVGGGIFSVLGLAATMAGGATPIAFAMAAVSPRVGSRRFRKASRYSSAALPSRERAAFPGVPSGSPGGAGSSAESGPRPLAPFARGPP